MAPVVGIPLALRAVELLGARGRIGTGDLMAACEVSRSAAFRCLRALEREGYALLSPTGRGYGPGPALLALQAIPAIDPDVRARRGQALAAVRDVVGESVHSTILVGLDVLVTDGRRSVHDEDMGSRIGMTAAAHAMAAGKLLLAALDARLVERMLPPDPLAQRTPFTAHDRETFLRELDVVREEGAAYTSHESELGIESIAVPLDGLSHRDRVALVVSVPRSRGGQPRLRDLGARARAVISARPEVEPWKMPPAR
ncbi:IclR family transcriptional regulator [Microbacterium sediminicola]|uniref:IclR family transcriptional regulator n=1 Tax=Microbacterium sediminicola TaxID=415210 RepID=A0ABN2ID35_9MICO